MRSLEFISWQSLCGQGFFLLLADWVCVSPGGWWASAVGRCSGLVPGLVPTEVSPAQSRVTSRGELLPFGSDRTAAAGWPLF